MAEIALEFFIRVGSYAKGVDLYDLCIKKCLGVGFHIFRQSGNKILRFAAARCDEYMLTAPDPAEYLILAGKLFRI